MKKHQFYLWLIALAGLITSCSQDKTDMPVAGESNRVSFTASLPQDFEKSGKRALPSATSHSLRCILEVWNKENTPELIKRMEQNGLTGDNVVFDFEIEPGTYDCLFWADFIATGAAADQNATIGSVTYTHYTDKYYKTDDGTNGLKAVSIIADNYVFSTDARDAFFGKYELQKSVAAVTDPTITLTRPFAKLTIKEKDADAYNLCKTMTASYDVPNVFNVLNGTASGSHTASCNAAPAGDGSTDLTLFTDYVLTTSAARETMPEISLTFTKQDNAGAELQPVTIPAGVPVQRNYRTNAAGSLISEQPVPTNGVKLTVNMSENWTDENYDLAAIVWDGTSTSKPAGYSAFTPGEVDITTVAELAWLAQQSVTFKDYTFKLTADFDLNNHEWTPIGSKQTFQGTFDGQGHTVSNLQCTTSSKAGLFAETYGATVKNVTVSGTVSGTASEVCMLGGIIAYVMSNSTITGCTNQCTITATGDENKCHVGGIAGYVTNLSDNSNSTISNNTNTGTLVTNGYSQSTVGGIIGTASATKSSSITLTGNNYSNGTPSDVCIGYCFMDNSTITIDGTGATNNKPFPVSQP